MADKKPFDARDILAAMPAYAFGTCELAALLLCELQTDATGFYKCVERFPVAQ